MLKWEPVQNDNSTVFLCRSKIFGGWLIIASTDALTHTADGYGGYNNEPGYEWRNSITFVPDPNHEWKLNQ